MTQEELLPMTQEEFEKFPIISRTERDSEECEGITEIVEIRNVNGEEIGTVKPVVQTNLYAVLEESKSKGHTEVWHRWVLTSFVISRQLSLILLFNLDF